MLSEITGFRIQPAGIDVADLLNPALQESHVWGGNDDEDDPRTRRGVSACRTLDELAAYLAGPGSGIAYGVGEWVIVEMYGPESTDTPMDVAHGEVLVHPEQVVSVRPLDDAFFAMIGDAYDARIAD